MERTNASAGLVYVHAGCLGRDAGAPAGVTDLKAAIRYLRYSDEGVAGNTDNIFVFGMSGGGAQSAVVGATGDSELYDAYLEEIGAVQGVSDAAAGSMDWCSITNLDTADESYEWMMGGNFGGGMPNRRFCQSAQRSLKESRGIRSARCRPGREHALRLWRR